MPSDSLSLIFNPGIKDVSTFPVSLQLVQPIKAKWALIKDSLFLYEEDLKVNFIVPILNKIKFKSFDKKVRDFYELPMIYKTSQFILNGTCDFVVSEGLVESKKPYFFIQEFKI